jgi:hypothetical protein
VIVALILAGGTAAGVAEAISSGHGGPGSPGGGSSVPTATVVRTDLINTVQVGGSIGYAVSYTIAAPQGTSASQLSQQQQTVTADRQQLTADERTESDASAADNEATAADEANVRADEATLRSDKAGEQKACAGVGASSAACSQDRQQVSQDQASLTQARQQLAQARSAAVLDDDQNEAKVTADRSKLAADQATLASQRETATNPGTAYTWLPQPGAVIREDQRVYSVSNVPVPLLYGLVPAYRAFYLGMSAGADVGELTSDLIRLGYGDGLTQSDHYSAATVAAVQRWQKALGMPVTGQILLGEVVFEPGPIQVTSVTATVGSPAGSGSAAAGGGGGGAGGTVLTATDTTPVVTIDLPVTQEYLVKPGDSVSVVLPNGTSTVGGRVQTVGNVATCPGGGSTGTGNGSTGDGSSGSASQSPCSANGSSSTPTVTVTITMDHTAAGASLDQAPVNVNITTQRADGVLAVPVNALLALAGGGYGVDVVTGNGAIRLTGVTTGLYSSTLVQVSGPGIASGTKVEVPTS